MFEYRDGDIIDPWEADMLDLIEAPTKTVTLTALDRGDCCGTQAYTVASKDGHADLMFCRHHLNKHGARLILEGWNLAHDTEALEALGAPLDINSL